MEKTEISLEDFESGKKYVIKVSVEKAKKIENGRYFYNLILST